MGVGRISRKGLANVQLGGQGLLTRIESNGYCHIYLVEETWSIHVNKEQ